MEDLTGRQFGSYRIVAPLGEGGMAAVYKAFQPSMERYVAIKVLPRHLAASPEFVARFNREAKLLAQLQHPHILPVFDYGETEGYTYIVMPFVQSGTLSDAMREQRFSLPEVRNIMAQLGRALGYAHSHGMIHRDIKPSNVLIDETNNCLLTDFGLARMTEVTSRLTSSGAVMGTPAYMSPEQGAGENLDGRSDIYSLGIILYELVTGRVPFMAETPIAIIYKHLQDPLPLPRALNPDLPEDAERVLLKALAKSRDDRYQTADEFVRAIQRALPETEAAEKTLLTNASRDGATLLAQPPPAVATIASAGQTASMAGPGTQALPPAAEPTTRTAPGPSRSSSLPIWMFAGIGALVLVLIAVFVALDLLNKQAATAPPIDVVQPPATTTRLVPTSLAPGPASGGINCMGAQSGDTLSMLYQWSGQEEERLNQILQPLVDACGIVLQPESSRDQALLDTRVTGGTPPDVVFWQVTQLVQYQDQLKTMDSLGADSSSYTDFFLAPMTVEGKWLGLPVKADIKSIIWYSPVNFEAGGYAVPTTWEELDALVEKIVADGKVPWSMGFESGDATGWTGSDFIQDILLVQQGPDFVNGIIDGSVPYNDPGVRQAYETYGKWATDGAYTVGGAQGTVSTAFVPAIYKPFADPPEAMMVKQSGFAGGEIQKQFPDLVYGTDYDFFVIPGLQGLQGAVEPMMAFSDKPAAKALVAYLSSPLGGANWAAAGFDLSPNKNAAGNFTDPALIKKADAFYSTHGFTPDIGDSIAGGFGSAEWAAIISYVNGGDLDQALADAAAQMPVGFTFRDDFENQLAEGWAWEAEDPARWSLSAVPGSLMLVVTDPPANVLLRDAPAGNFEITTLLRFQPTTNFQFAGLMVIQDEGNGLHFGRAYCDVAGTCVGEGLYVDKIENGAFATDTFRAPFSGEEVYLRVRREGNAYSAFYSEDGEAWFTAGEYAMDLSPIRVGLWAGQAREEIAAVFDYFIISEP